VTTSPHPGGVHEIGTETIRLRTDERGLPVDLAITPRALAMSPDELARRILAMCELSARRAQAARRHELLAGGFAPAVVDGLNLATAEDVRRLEAAMCADGPDDDPEGLPSAWLRGV